MILSSLLTKLSPIFLGTFLQANLDESELVGVQSLADPMMTTAQSLTELLVRFLLNLLSCLVLVRCFYYPKSRRSDYSFTFLTFSSAMLLLLYVMGRVDVGVGLTLGLFAIFGVIRYRTETVPIREMTYLFVIIAIAAVNGLAPLYRVVDLASSAPYYTLDWGNLSLSATANLMAILLIWVLERCKGLKQRGSKLILYDRIDLIVPSRREELIADLEKRCGVNIDDIEIGNIDFLKDSAYIKIYYKSVSSTSSTIDHVVRNKQFVESQNL